MIAVVTALFPVVFIVSSAFNRDNTLSGAQVVPTHVTLHNFGNLLHNNVSTSGNGKADAPYVKWVINSMIVAGVTALFSTMLGALAAYAFSRFRFKGRRMGMVALLLIQMFPQIVAVAAIYLLILNVGNIFHAISLNTLLAVIVVYLGGAMGVQTWLMKGFFDTIPKELDESARVDGATAAQIFWGVILPLAAPVLVVVALISFVFTLNEFVIASALLQTNDHFTLPVGMQGFISQQYGQRWGPFAAGSLMAMVPVVLLFLFLQRWIVSGLTAGSVKG
jgi:arabinogalactan oligomer/maltooligosaccharide transport system permease protein